MEEIIVGSDYSGVGAFDQALNRLGVPYKKLFACDFDYWARLTYILNFGTENDLELAKSKEHKMFADGMEFIILGKDLELEKTIIESKNPKLKEKEINSLLAKIEKLETQLREFEKKCVKLNVSGPDLETRKYNFAVAADDFASKFSFYYPFNVYDREIPEEPLDIFMTSPPCQAFSLAGKRLGKADIKGILFFNSLEFIAKNKPRFFKFENVKGLLSDDKTNKSAEFGNTFQEWINYLGGKSINGLPTIFPYEDSVSYHIYFKVLNAKEHGVPQNRERIFIIGIRDDKENDFQFPKTIPLEKRLKDVLEQSVDEKYFLSDKMLQGFIKHADRHNEKGNGFAFSPNDLDKEAKSITTASGTRNTDNWIDVEKLGFINQDTQASQVIDENGLMTSICAGTHGYANGYIKTDETIQLNDPVHSNDRVYSDEVIRINPSKESRGKQPYQQNRVYDINGVCPTLDTIFQGGKNILLDEEYKIGAIRGRNPKNPKSRKSGLETVQMLEINENGVSNALTTVQKNNVVVIISNTQKGYEIAEEEDSINFSVPNSKTRRGRVGKGVSQTLDTSCSQGVLTKQRIRRLTPTECFRLMDFNSEMIEKTISSGLISDSQLYKQAGNSIVVEKLCLLIKKLLKIQ